MKQNRIRLGLTQLFAALIFVPGVAWTEDEDTVSGSISVGSGITMEGSRDSSKFDEYRDVPSGVFGDAELEVKNDDGLHGSFEATNIGRDDQAMAADAGKYGSFKVELDYSEIPHRYAYGAQSLYSGSGSDTLRLSDSLQQRLQNAGSTTNVVSILNAEQASAIETDFEIERKRGGVKFNFQGADPFAFQLEYKRDERDGTKPMGAGFRFSNAMELIEPRDYVTNEYKATAEYGTKEAYLALSYYASVFQNDTGTLRWDNPFRTGDSTSAQAYSTPVGGPGAYVSDGPAEGLYDLPPDNLYHSISATGVLRELPVNSQLSAVASWGWMLQNDDLLPYTTNTAIVPGATAGTPGGVPFNASDRANLPSYNPDQEVNIQSYNLVLTSKPTKTVNTKLRYRYYERDNKATEVDFPGYARFDSTWEGVEIHTEPIGWQKHTAGAEIGIDVMDQSQLGLNYKYERMSRDHREVDNVDDNAFGASLDSSLLEILDIRTAYEHSVRRIDGEYDPSVPFDGEAVNSQLPTLRKYDEADRDQDKISLLATLSPTEALGITGSFSYGQSDYTNSSFGLTEDEFSVYSIDMDYSIDEESKVFGFYSFETHQGDQRNRQWAPNGIGDPFTRELALDSNSNWTAELQDDVHSVGAGFQAPIIPSKLLFKVAYSLSYANGKVNIDSPLGTAATDANPFPPDDFNLVDDTMIHTVNPHFIVAISKNISLMLGYLWEKYDVSDYNKVGYTNVPANAAGAYNGALLMGTLPVDNYEVNYTYAKLKYSF